MSESLLKRLYDSNPEISDAAAREIRALPPDQLLLVLKEEARQQRQFNRKYVCCLALVLAVFTCWWFRLYEWVPRGRGLVIMLGTLGFCMLFVGITVCCLRDAKAHSIALKIVMEAAEDPRYLGIALLVLEQSPDYETNFQLRAIIGKGFNGLRADQSGLFHSDDRQALRSLLESHSWDEDFTRSVLTALQQIGTRDDIPAVEKLMQRVHLASKLWEAAYKCLLYLQQRNSEQQDVQSLLRPASQNQPAPETLLRAAVAKNDVIAPEQLLRPR